MLKTATFFPLPLGAGKMLLSESDDLNGLLFRI
jgi:hypothetical protein